LDLGSCVATASCEEVGARDHVLTVARRRTMGLRRPWGGAGSAAVAGRGGVRGGDGEWLQPRGGGGSGIAWGNDGQQHLGEV
jgi:hypothetical protein